MSKAQEMAMYAAVRDLVDRKVIRRNFNAKYNLPVLMIKQGTKWRFCVDAREINARIEPMFSVIPKIENTTRSFSEALYCSVFDLDKGYFQIPYDQESSEYFTFTLPNGERYSFDFLVMGERDSAEASSSAIF
jgi:hypothetical protein